MARQTLALSAPGIKFPSRLGWRPQEIPDTPLLAAFFPVSQTRNVYLTTLTLSRSPSSNPGTSTSSLVDVFLSLDASQSGVASPHSDFLASFESNATLMLTINGSITYTLPPLTLDRQDSEPYTMQSRDLSTQQRATQDAFIAAVAALSSITSATITLDDNTAAPPDAPALPTTSGVADTQATINWTLPNNNGAALTAMRVEWREGTSGGFTEVVRRPTDTSHTLTGLTASTQYQVRIRAENSEGVGGYSPVLTFSTTADPTAPTATITTAAQTVNGGATVTLDAAAVAGTGTTISSIAWTADGGTFSDASIIEPVWTAPTPLPETAYTLTLTVTASNGKTATASVVITARGRALLLSDFDSAGKQFDVLALIDGNAASTDGRWYADANRPPAGGTVLAGEIGLGGNQVLISRIWHYANNRIRIQDNNQPTGLNLGDYFNTGGNGADLTLTIQDAQGSASVVIAGNIERRGGQFVNITTSDAFETVADRIDSGGRFIFALWRDAPTPAADAPTPTISPVAAGDEGTTVRLVSTITGGTYDSLEYAWSVSAGTLDNASLAEPTWTRPQVRADSDITVDLTITARGTGTNALANTSDTAAATQVTARVRNVLPVADAPAVTINPIAAGNEGTTVTLGATLTGGTYDNVTYAWSVDEGTLNNAAAVAPVWTRPQVASTKNVTVRLTVTANGTGTLARNGTSDTSTEATRAASVRNVLPVASAPTVTINAVPAGNEGTTVTLGAVVAAGGTYDGAVEYAWRVSGGTLNNAAAAAPVWTRPQVSADIDHTIDLTITVRGTGTVARNGTTDTANATQVSSTVRNILPVAAAPGVTINPVPAGDEGTTVTLGATLTGGTYDGAVEYAWTVNGGTLSSASAAAPVWTRPLVTVNADYTIDLTITVRGTGTVARAMTSDTANAPRIDAKVRNIPPVAAAPAVTINPVAAGDSATTVTLGAALTGGTYDEIAYTWQVSGGTLDDANAAAPVWTRPTVTEDADYTIDLAIAVRGRGTTARIETSDNATATQVTTTVRYIRPLAVAPIVALDAIAAGDEGTTVTLGATLTGGTYDDLTYAWTADEGTLDDAAAAAPVWTRPLVTATKNVTLRLVVTATGDGTTARAGSTVAAAEVTRDASVRNIPPLAVAPTVTINPIEAGDEGTTVTLGATISGGTYDTLTYAWTADEGTLSNAALATPVWTRPQVTETKNVTLRLVVTANGAGTNARSGSTAASTAATRAASVRDVPPLPTAPTAAIITAAQTVDAGDTVTLDATATPASGSGTTISSIAWTTDGGTFDDASILEPTWTAPSPAAQTNYTLTLTVTASNGETDSADVIITVRAAAPPTAGITTAAQTVDAAGTVTLDATATPSVGTTIASTVWTTDGGTFSDANALEPTWTAPAPASATTYTLTLTVTDSNGKTDTATVSITVRAAGPPTAGITTAAQTVASGAAVTLDATATPVAGTTIASTVWTADGGTFNNANLLEPVWTAPSPAAETAYTLTLTVTDSNGKTATATVVITVQASAAPSAAIATLAQTIDPGATVTLDATATPTAGTTIASTVWTADGGSFSDANLLEPVWTAPFPGAQTAYTLTLTVTDSNAKTDTVTVVITVRATAPPTATITTAAQTVDAGGTVTLDAAAAAVTGTTVARTVWTADGGTFNNANALEPVWTAPSPAAATSYTLTLTVTDSNGNTGTATVVITVRAAGPPTAAIVTAAQTVDAGATLTLDATATPFTGTTIASTVWTATGGAFNNASLLEPIWTAPSPAAETAYTLTLTVTDSNAKTATVNVVITVRAAPDLAVAITTAPQTVPVGRVLALEATATPAAGTTITRIAWTVVGQISADVGTFSDASILEPTWTAPAPELGERFTLTLTVTDSLGRTVSQDLRILVRGRVILPTVANQTALVGAVFSVVLPAVTRGGISPYSYSVSGIGNGITFDAATRTLNGPATSVGTLIVTYRASDSATPTGVATQLFTITITAPPTLTLPLIPNQDAAIGEIYSFALPPATGGIGPYSYTVTGVGFGLTYDADSRTISGLPSQITTINILYEVEDSALPTPTTTSIRFNIIIGAGGLTVIVPSQPYKLYLGTEDVFSDVIEDITAERGRTFDSRRSGFSVTGSINFTLPTYRKRYTLDPGTRLQLVRQLPGVAPIEVPLWTGFLDEPDRSTQFMREHTELRGYGPLGLISETDVERITIPAHQMISTGAAMRILLDSLQVPAANIGTLAGSAVMAYWWVEGRENRAGANGLQAARELEVTERGFIKETADGRIDFESLNQRVLAVMASPRLIFSGRRSRATPNAINLRDLDVTAERKDIANVISARIRSLQEESETTVWGITVDSPGMPMEFAPGQERIFLAENITGRGVGVGSWEPLDRSATPLPDYQARASASPSSADRTSVLTVTPITSDEVDAATIAGGLRISVRNSSPTETVYLHLLKARGHVLTEQAAYTLERENAASVALYGRREFRLGAEFFTALPLIESALERQLDQRSVPQNRGTVTAPFDAHPETLAYLDLSHVVQLERDNHTTANMIIEKIRHRILPNQMHDVEYTMLPTGSYANTIILDVGPPLGTGILG